MEKNEEINEIEVKTESSLSEQIVNDPLTTGEDVNSQEAPNNEIDYKTKQLSQIRSASKGSFSESSKSSKSHIWKNPKKRRLMEKCVFCDKVLTLAKNSTVWKCKICFVRAHSSCASTAIETKGCLAPHEKLLYSKDHTDRTPLIAFINPKSGAQSGAKLYDKLCKYLGKNQVFNLKEGGPEPGLQKFKDVPNFRILAAGGDGTVAWILETLDKLQLTEKPPLAILPLGTGNDLARTFKWGGGYNGEKLLPILVQIQNAMIVPFDRWRVIIQDEKGKVQKIMNNYFSIGPDADVAIQFHNKRNERPDLFKSRVANKMWYAFYGSKLLGKEEVPLKEIVDLEVDGDAKKLPENIIGLIVLNLRSYAGGNDLWGKLSPEAQRNLNFPALVPSYNDGQMEVVGLKSVFDMVTLFCLNTIHKKGTVVSGLSKPKKIAQTRAIEIRLKKNIQRVLQLDGEPWIQEGPFTIKISIFDQAMMLLNEGNVVK